MTRDFLLAQSEKPGGIVVENVSLLFLAQEVGRIGSLTVDDRHSLSLGYSPDVFGSGESGLYLFVTDGACMTSASCVNSVDYLHGDHGPRGESCGRAVARGGAVALPTGPGIGEISGWASFHTCCDWPRVCRASR